MTTAEVVQQEPTPASVWQGVAGGLIGDELLDWPPDLFALTDVILGRSEAYRFAMSPPGAVGWPPEDSPGWAEAVVDAGRRWSAWVEDGSGDIPDLLAREWKVVRAAADLPLAHLSEARDWRVCEALLTLHAIADEACAGLGVALDGTGGQGVVYRARGRELLARTGSLARMPAHLLRVLPKLRTPASGSSVHVLSRYAAVHGPGVEVRWHKVPGRRAGNQADTTGVNYLLLPWPLRVRETDFRPVPGSAHTLTGESFGFFQFAPTESLDLDLVDRMLVAALDEVGTVDVVVLPESAVDQSEIDGLETMLARHGVTTLIAGVRQRSPEPGRHPANWVHIAIWIGDQWVHIRQGKHHRWSLDEGQIYQYHLGGALHPHIRWWEAMEVPRRSIQLIDVGERATFVSLVCEDLAQIDDVSNVLRSIGPTMVITPLLDGPQLSSRWAARYASVLADDPGSAVLTLTSAGMAHRSRPPGQERSAVIALWKNRGGQPREIPLEDDALGVLLSASTDRATRRTADGRRPVEDGNELFNMTVFQVRPAETGSRHPAPAAVPSRPALRLDELTVLTSWAEAAADALVLGAERVGAVVGEARAGRPWRTALRIPEPSPELDRAIDRMIRMVTSVAAEPSRPPPEPARPAVRDGQAAQPGLDRLVRRVLCAALEQRQIPDRPADRAARSGREGRRCRL